MSEKIEIEYAPPIWFKPWYKVRYHVKAERAKKCREMYGWGTSAFYSCLVNDPETRVERVE